MDKARQDKNISDYNTFHVFEEIYGDDKNFSPDYFETPESDLKSHKFIFWFSFFLFITILSFSVHPILSYYLKTPYPLVVIAEDSMRPSFNPNDLIINKGVINPQNINIGDIILFKSFAEPDVIAVKRVTNIINNTLIVQGDMPSSPSDVIYFDQVIGQVVGNGNLRLPLVGSLSTFLARR